MPPHPKDAEHADWRSHLSDTAINGYVAGAADVDNERAVRAAHRHV
jgi:hypothetical protein